MEWTLLSSYMGYAYASILIYPKFCPRGKGQLTKHCANYCSSQSGSMMEMDLLRNPGIPKNCRGNDDRPDLGYPFLWTNSKSQMRLQMRLDQMALLKHVGKTTTNQY